MCPHQNAIKNLNFPGKSQNFGRVVLPGNPQLAPAASTRRKSFQIHLSSWGVLGSPHALVPSGAKESCGRGATCSHPKGSHHWDGLFQDPASHSLHFPTKAGKNPGFLSEEAILRPKRGYFSILPDFILDLISAK